MAKKSFIDKGNPALQFISTATSPELTRESAETPDGYKLNPLYIEIKSRRLQLVVQPSLHERVKARAKAGGLSVNEYVHQILDKATKEEL